MRESIRELQFGVAADVVECVLRGRPSKIQPDGNGAWLDDLPIAHRVLPEAFGISLPMFKTMLETISVLYGSPSEGISPTRLKALYHTLNTTSIITIYSSPHPPRVQVGDLLLRHVLYAVVYLDGFNLKPCDAQLQNASAAILELFYEVLYMGYSAARSNLAFIVGASLCPPDKRCAALSILRLMADNCGCDDIEEATRTLLKEVWKRRDEGREDWRWSNVMTSVEGLDILYI
ncbi:hypothetical protein Q8F55_003344 [Vanrija albida]|uniref:Uncharacterized protein n=1 Tax=Vanrija albida TaxID=181172 RepID=A0ABR3Q425_9TREE